MTNPSDASEWRDYSAMDRAELERRCRAAEDVAIFYSYTSGSPGDRSDALFELWRRWQDLPGVNLDPKANAELISMEKPLAAQRRAIRDATLRRIRGESA